MGNSRKIALIATLAITVVAMGCLVPVGDTRPVPADEAGREAIENNFLSTLTQLDSQPATAPAPASVASQPEAETDQVAVAPQPVVNEPPTAEPVDDGEGTEEQNQDDPMAAAPPQAPSNLTLDYDIASHIARLSWKPVSSRGLERYLVKRWSESDIYRMGWVFRELQSLNPAAAPYVDDVRHQMELIRQGGWTYSERMNIMAALAADMDALLAMMASTRGAGHLLFYALSQATEFRTTSTSYNDTIRAANSCYVYAVCARNRSRRASNPSNCKGQYAVFAGGHSPAGPAGVTATAYDPGAGMQWSRSSESDLAGYNIYRVSGQSRTRLNQGLLSAETTFFYDQGVSGAVYGVTAVDVANRESQATTAGAVLAPATIYDQDNPAWRFTGQWARENYTDSGGNIIRVAQDTGATASITFSGRMVKAYSAYYWSCGSARFSVDGVVRSIRCLYNPSTTFHMQPFVITGLAPGQHTLTIEALGSGGSEGYNFINFDSVEVR